MLRFGAERVADQGDGKVEDLGGVGDDGRTPADALVEVQALGDDVEAGQVTCALRIVLKVTKLLAIGTQFPKGSPSCN